MNSRHYFLRLAGASCLALAFAVALAGVTGCKDEKPADKSVKAAHSAVIRPRPH